MPLDRIKQYDREDYDGLENIDLISISKKRPGFPGLANESCSMLFGQCFLGNLNGAFD